MRQPSDILTRFMKYVTVTDACWIWTGAKDRKGYGRFSLAGKNERAYRVSWMVYKGEIPPGLCVCHSCDNPACVNPGHLWLGTKSENTIDMYSKNRQHKGPHGKKPTSGCKGVKNINAKFNPGIVRSIRADRVAGFSLRELARKYNTSFSNISRIVKKMTWKDV